MEISNSEKEFVLFLDNYGYNKVLSYGDYGVSEFRRTKNLVAENRKLATYTLVAVCFVVGMFIANHIISQEIYAGADKINLHLNK